MNLIKSNLLRYISNSMCKIILTLLFSLSLLNTYSQIAKDMNNENNIALNTINTTQNKDYISNSINQENTNMSWYYASGNLPFPARYGHTSVVYDNKMWVIGGSSSSSTYRNDVWNSPDGAVWIQATTSASFPERRLHTSVIYDNKMWVIGGSGGGIKNDVWYSTDGVNWTQATASTAFTPRYGHTSVVYDNKMWVIGGYNGSYRNDVWYSTDGVNWTQTTASAAFSTRQGHTSVVYDNKMWVFGGYNGYGYRNDVWYSTDGVVWTQATESADFIARAGHTSVVYDNKMWVIGGYYFSSGYIYLNDVWYSLDGVIWIQATASPTFSSRYSHTSVVYNDKMWVIGGEDNSYYRYRNDVWCSSDGVVWTDNIKSATLTGRNNHTSLVYNNKMWVIAGYKYDNDNIYMNDVWYSSDGIVWTQAIASTAFSARRSHTSVVYDNKMWVIGGYTYSGGPVYMNDVWYSTDGVNWIQATAFDTFPARYSHTSVVYDNKMWVIGGYSKGFYRNDAWYSIIPTSVIDNIWSSY